MFIQKTITTLTTLFTLLNKIFIFQIILLQKPKINLMNKLLLLLCLATIALQAHAQKGEYGIGLNVGAAYPFNENLNLGPALSVNTYYHTTNKSTLQLSYSYFSNKITNAPTDIKLPTKLLLLGYQQYFSSKRNWFATADFGTLLGINTFAPAVGIGAGYSIQSKIGAIDMGTKFITSFNSASNNIWLQPYVGYRLRLSKK